MTPEQQAVLHDEYGKLIQLAAVIASQRHMPDVEQWRWPSRIPRALNKDARWAEEYARDQCAEWAVEARKIADRLISLVPPNA